MQIIFIMTLYRNPKYYFTPLHALDTSIMFNVHEEAGEKKIKKSVLKQKRKINQIHTPLQSKKKTLSDISSLTLISSPQDVYAEEILNASHSLQTYRFNIKFKKYLNKLFSTANFLPLTSHHHIHCEFAKKRRAQRRKYFANQTLCEIS